MNSNIPFVYLAAGISSRFGGKIKALAPVGPRGESMLAISMDQAIAGGFGSFVIVASAKTIEPLKSEFGDSYRGYPITYTFQETPAYRTKPFGTAHAILSVRGIVNGPFGVGSTDDLLGKETYRIVYQHLLQQQLCIPGYVLNNVIPPTGNVNRAILDHENNRLKKIAEHFNISREKIGTLYSGEEYSAMLIYGLNSSVLDFINQQFSAFVNQHPDDATTEIILSNILNDIVASKTSLIYVTKTHDFPLFLTYPEDEEIVKRALREQP